MTTIEADHGRFSPMSAALSGFGLVFRKPGSILIWTLLYFPPVLGILLSGLAMPHGVGAVQTDQAGPTVVLERLVPLLLCVFALVGVRGVVQAATLRTVLGGRAGAPGGLGWGREEFEQTALYLVRNRMYWWPPEAVVASLATIPLALVGAFAGSRLQPPLNWATWGATGVAVACVMIYLGVRMSLMRAHVFRHGLSDSRGSWSASRGAFWSLLLMNILVWFVSVVTFLIPAAVAISLYERLVGTGVIPSWSALTLGDVAQLDGRVLGTLAGAAGLVSLYAAVHHALVYAPAAAAYAALERRRAPAA